MRRRSPYGASSSYSLRRTHVAHMESAVRSTIPVVFEAHLPIQDQWRSLRDGRHPARSQVLQRRTTLLPQRRSPSIKRDTACSKRPSPYSRPGRIILPDSTHYTINILLITWPPQDRRTRSSKPNTYNDAYTRFLGANLPHASNTCFHGMDGPRSSCLSK